MNALLLMTVTLTFIPLLTWALCFVSDWHTRLGHCKGMFGPVPVGGSVPHELK